PFRGGGGPPESQTPRRFRPDRPEYSRPPFLVPGKEGPRFARSVEFGRKVHRESFRDTPRCTANKSLDRFPVRSDLDFGRSERRLEDHPRKLAVREREPEDSAALGWRHLDDSSVSNQL